MLEFAEAVLHDIRQLKADALWIVSTKAVTNLNKGVP